MKDKDFDNVRRYEPEVGGCAFPFGFYSTMKEEFEGDWVSIKDYRKLLKAYKELKWMYEELCK